MLYAYLTCLILSVLISTLSWYFNRKYLPNEFGSLGRIMWVLGIILKVSLTLLTVVHWLVLVLVLFNCYKAFSMTECVKSNSALSTSIIIQSLIRLGLWSVQHIVAAIVRTFIDVDIFIYSPEDPESNRFLYVCFGVLGP